MTPYFSQAGITIYHGDCRGVMAGMPDASVDAVVCDPPAGVSFMGKNWDNDKGGRDEWIAWLADVMREALRVLKPGGHALVWALPRTSHWTGMACENAGFFVVDSIAHMFGSGFPKSANRGWIATGRSGGKVQVDTGGNALKPAHEVWWLCRKPLVDTIVNTVWDSGVGGLQIDACRVGTDDDRARPPHPSGRWPPNVVFTHAPDCDDGACVEGCPVREIGEQSGVTVSTDAPRHNGEFKSVAKGRDLPHTTTGHNDTGTAARFFPCFRYVAKPSTREREAGCEALPVRTAAELTDRKPNTAGLQSPRAGAGRTSNGRRNNHPTVKPIALIRWLVRLVTPPGGVVLDPFMGSGTTGAAAAIEGFRFVGIDMDQGYCDIAQARIAWHAANPHAFDKSRDSNARQLGLFDK